MGHWRQASGRVRARRGAGDCRKRGRAQLLPDDQPRISARIRDVSLPGTTHALTLAREASGLAAASSLLSVSTSKADLDKAVASVNQRSAAMEESLKGLAAIKRQPSLGSQAARHGEPARRQHQAAGGLGRQEARDRSGTRPLAGGEPCRTSRALRQDRADGGRRRLQPADRNAVGGRQRRIRLSSRPSWPGWRRATLFCWRA